MRLALRSVDGAFKLEEAQTKWFKLHGGECSAVRIGTSDYGRGLFAARSIRAGEEIVQVPNELILTARRLPDEVRSMLVTEYDWCPLALLILAEEHKGEASAWAPYISCLPSPGEHYSTIFWGEEYLKHLECTRVSRGTSERREMISEEFTSVKKVLDACPRVFGENVTLYRFAHAYATVVSRAWNTTSSEIALRPFVDFCNHNPNSHAMVSEDSSKRATSVVAERDYSEGEEIFISYGRRSNAVLAVDYGFTVPDNTCEQAELWMEIPFNDPLRERKLELLRAYNMPTLLNEDGMETGEVPVILEEVLTIDHWEDGVVLPQARAFSRIIVSDTFEDLQEMMEESEALDAPLAYLPRKDGEKEHRAMNYLMKMIVDNIDLHERALESVQNDTSMQPFRQQIARTVLTGELRVLQNASGWLQRELYIGSSLNNVCDPVIRE